MENNPNIVLLNDEDGPTQNEETIKQHEGNITPLKEENDHTSNPVTPIMATDSHENKRSSSTKDDETGDKSGGSSSSRSSSSHNNSSSPQLRCGSGIGSGSATDPDSITQQRVNQRREWIMSQTHDNGGIPIYISTIPGAECRDMDVPLRLVYVNSNLKKLLFKVKGITVTANIFIEAACFANGIRHEGLTLWRGDIMTLIYRFNKTPKGGQVEKEWRSLGQIIPPNFRNPKKNRMKDSSNGFPDAYQPIINRMADFIECFETGIIPPTAPKKKKKKPAAVDKDDTTINSDISKAAVKRKLKIEEASNDTQSKHKKLTARKIVMIDDDEDESIVDTGENILYKNNDRFLADSPRPYKKRKVSPETCEIESDKEENDIDEMEEGDPVSSPERLPLSSIMKKHKKHKGIKNVIHISTHETTTSKLATSPKKKPFKSDDESVSVQKQQNEVLIHKLDVVLGEMSYIKEEIGSIKWKINSMSQRSESLS